MYRQAHRFVSYASHGQVFEESNAWQVFTQFKPVFDEFSQDASMRFARPIFEDSQRRDFFGIFGTWSEDSFKSLLLVEQATLGVPWSEWKSTLSKWKRDPETNYNDVVYRVVTSALGLPFDYCKRAGLELLVSLEDPLCIGLFKPDIGQVRCRRLIRRLYEGVQTIFFGRRRYATVCVADNHLQGHGNLRWAECDCVLLETEYIWVRGHAVMEDIAGIWVPTRVWKADDVVQFYMASGASLDKRNKRTVLEDPWMEMFIGGRPCPSVDGISFFFTLYET